MPALLPSIDQKFMRKTNVRRRLTYILVATVSSGLLSRSADCKQIVTGTGGDVAPHVKVFDGATGVETNSFLPYGSGVTAGVRVATGDVNGDGVVDVVTGLGPGLGPQVKAFSGVDQSELKSFFAQAPDFAGGIHVASGDVNGDGFDDIVTGSGTPSGGLVKTFSGMNNSLLQNFFTTAEANVEVRVAAGDVNGDGVADIITGWPFGEQRAAGQSV
jgi:fibronectin-binding autotransporter adhesin